MSLRIFNSIRSLSSLSKEFMILGLDYPSSRFEKDLDNSKDKNEKLEIFHKKIEDNDKKLSEYDILFGLEFPSSRFK
jgi:hypothetical protein